MKPSNSDLSQQPPLLVSAEDVAMDIKQALGLLALLHNGLVEGRDHPTYKAYPAARLVQSHIRLYFPLLIATREKLERVLASTREVPIQADEPEKNEVAA